MKLSFCMIVKNEEASLPSCLASVKDIVDEMVVLDTGSTDQTVKIAREFGARVHHFKWCNDFSAARNESLKYVHGDWVLVLDADEQLKPEIVPQLRLAIQNERHLVVNLIRQEVGASQSPYSLVSRLFRRHSAVHFSRPYHSMVDDSVSELLQREPEWQIVSLPDVAILHYGYQPGAIASRDKFARAQAAMEGFLAIHPTDSYACSKLGALYVQTGQLSQGIELLERGLGSEGILIDASVLYELHYHLGNAYTRLRNLAQAKVHYQAAIQQMILPKLKIGAYNNLASILMTNGDLIGAREAYEITLQIDPNFAVGMYNLGMTLKAMGDLVEAINAYRQAIQLNPNYAEAYQNLGVVLLKVGNVPESLAAFRQAIKLHQLCNNSAEAERLRQGLREMGFQS